MVEEKSWIQRPIAPLSGTFMAASIIGFFIAVFYYEAIANAIGESFSFTFLLFFIMTFIASIISMTYGPSEAELKMDRIK